MNAFDMNCVVHQSPGLWTLPGDRADTYKDLDYWVELAKLLEQGRFDGLFLADVLGIYDVYQMIKQPVSAKRHRCRSMIRSSLFPLWHMRHSIWGLG